MAYFRKMIGPNTLARLPRALNRTVLNADKKLVRRIRTIRENPGNINIRNETTRKEMSFDDSSRSILRGHLRTCTCKNWSIKSIGLV